MTTMKKFSLLAALAVLGTAASTYAATIEYKGGSQASADWTNTANWKMGVVPVAGDVALFDIGDVVTFTTNIPTTVPNTPDIQVNHASAQITFQPGSTATLTVPNVTVSAGSLKFDTRQQTVISSSISLSNSASLIVDAAMANSGTITLANTATMSLNAASSNSGAITVPSGTTFNVNAAFSNSAAMSITGVFDAVADVTNSSNPTLTINSGGVVKFRNGADLLGTATLDNGGQFYAIDGQSELSSNIAISTSCTGEFRVDFVSSGSPELKLNASYTSHAFTIRLMDTASVVNVQGTVVTSASFISPYTQVCDGKTGPGTLTWGPLFLTCN